jgi:hypothetical protein
MVARRAAVPATIRGAPASASAVLRTFLPVIFGPETRGQIRPLLPKKHSETSEPKIRVLLFQILKVRECERIANFLPTKT